MIPASGPGSDALEARLMLLTARAGLDDTQSERVRALAARPDLRWPELLRLAGRHHTLPLLSRQLHRHAGDRVPPEVRRELTNRSRRFAVRNLALARAGRRAMEALRSAGIEVRPFKGPSLAQRCYGDLALRPFRDVDLLVRRDTVRAAAGILAELEFRPPPGREPPDRTELTWGKELPLLGPGGVVVELHWALVPRMYGLDLDPGRGPRGPFGSAPDGGIGRSDGPAPCSSEELLLYLCIHGGLHRWARLKWVVDVAELLRTTELDGRALGRMARTCGAERLLGIGLRLARGLLAAPVPPELLERMEEETVRLVARETACRMFAAPGRLPSPGEQWRSWIRSRERTRDRFRVLWRTLLRPPTRRDRALLDLPGGLSPLYRILRPLRLLIEYGISGEEDP